MPSKKEKILIVEDSLIIGTDLRNKIKSFGYDVAGPVPSGEEALKLMEAEDPDFVLLDIMLAGELDGVQTAEILSEKYNKPFIYITGHVEDSTVDKARATNPVGFLVKPFDEVQIKITLEMALNKVKLDRELENYSHTLEKQVQERTREITEKLNIVESLIESIPYPVFFKDRDGNFMGCNHQFEEFFRISKEKMEGKNITEIASDDALKKFGFKDKEILRKGGTHIFHNTLKDPEGNLHQVEFRKAAFTDQDGEVAGMIGTLIDVTRIKQADELAMKLAGIVESTDDAVISIDTEGIIQTWNTGAENLYGYEIEEIVGKHSDILSPPEKRNELESIIERVMAGETIRSIETVRIRKDGKKLNIALTASPLKDGDGRITGASAIARDITERIRNERRLRVQATALNAAANGIMITNAEGNIIWSNPAFTALTGYNFDEAYDQNPVILKSGKHDDSFYKNLWETITSGSVWKGEIINRRKDGSLYNEDMTITPVTNKEGEITHYIAVKEDVTERKKAQEALYQSEERYRKVFEADRDGIIILESEKIIDCNPKILELFRTSKEELLNKDFRLLSPEYQPDGRTSDEKGREIIRKVKSGEPQFFEWRVLRNDKTMFDAEVSLTEISLGGSLHIHCRLRDITWIKKAQSAMKDSEEKFRSIFEQSSEGITLIDEEGKIIEWNRANEKITGIDRRDAIGRFIWDIQYELTHPDRRSKELIEITKKQWKKILETGIIPEQLQDREAFLVTRSGDMVAFQQLSFPIKSGKGYRIGSIVRNITDQKKAELVTEILYEISAAVNSSIGSQQLYNFIRDSLSKLVDTTNFFIALYDEKEDKITFPYFADEKDDIFEIPNASTSGSMSAEVIFSKQTLLLKKEDFKKKYSDKACWGTLPEVWMGIPLINDDQVIGAMGLQSYTDPDLYSEKDRDILEIISEQITISLDRKLSQEKIIEAKEAAEEASRLKSNLLANMNHELRTPMNGILGFADMLSDELNDQEQKEMVEKIKTSGKRLMTTLNSILELSRLETIKQDIDFEYIHPLKPLSSVINEFKAAADIKGLELNVQLNDPQFEVLVNTSMIELVFGNLLDNAVKYTEKGGIVISVDSEEYDGNVNGVVSFKDSGIGIDEKDQQIIFDEFRQASEGLSRGYEGTGLGLTLAKRMVNIMKGEISLKSEIGRGSTFTIKLPARKAVTTVPAVEKKREEKSTTDVSERPRQRKPNVLLVEDNSANKDVIVMFLRNLCNVDYARNGDEAMMKIKHKKYDSILMDINLGPQKNGIQLTREIRQFEAYKDIPIIAVTGYANPGDKEKLLSIGCSHYLAKPFFRRDIVSLMEKVFDEYGI